MDAADRSHWRSASASDSYLPASRQLTEPLGPSERVRPQTILDPGAGADGAGQDLRAMTSEPGDLFIAMQEVLERRGQRTSSRRLPAPLTSIVRPGAVSGGAEGPGDCASG